MKKALIFASLFLTLLISASYAQDKKVAVVTFYIVKQIDLNSFGPVAQTASVKLRDDPNFNMVPLLTEFHTRFFFDYAKAFPFQFVPEDQVINNEAYKAYVPNGLGGPFKEVTAKYYIPIDGYKVILPLIGHENERNMLQIFNQYDGVMKVYINFDLVKIGIGGMGVVRVNAHANISLFNKDGDKVFSVTKDAKSKKVSPLVAGLPVMTPEKIYPMCESAMDELMVDFQKDLPKMIRKTEAKL